MTIPCQGLYCGSGIFSWPFQGRDSIVAREYFNDRSKAGVLL